MLVVPDRLIILVGRKTIDWDLSEIFFVEHEIF